MCRVLIIGIDSLDPYLLQKFIDSLPNLRKLVKESPTFKMRSVFPPDTIPAWISIYTGLSPAEHGILYTFDIFESNWQSIANLNIDVFKGRTFWDISGKHGKKVCVLFPQAAFPPWEVNGIMVSRTIYSVEELKKKEIDVENNGVLTYPKSICEKYQISHLGTLSGKYPGFNKLGEYAKKAEKKILEQAEFGLEISKDYDWDLFFIYFSELDIIQHFFWRYFDSKDPTHPPNNPYKDVINNFYKLFDGIVSRFISAHPDTIKIVISDHGHKMRPPKTVNINEYLRRRGYLNLAKNKPLFTVIEKIKKCLLDFAHKRDLTYWVVRLGKMRLFSGASKKIYTSSAVIDFKNSMAYLSYFTGAKSYSEGGIHINKEKLRELGMKYEKVRDDLMMELYKLCNPKSREHVFEWIKKREDLYNGKNIHIYPDIVFKLKDEYGVYWSVNVPLIGISYEHNLSSGGHRNDAVFLISGLEQKVSTKKIELTDIAPTILSLLGIKGSFIFDGVSIIDDNIEGR